MDALSELEQNTSKAITALRSSQRIDIRTKVWIQPGNSSLRSTFVMEGLTADISIGGCIILTPRLHEPSRRLSSIAAMHRVVSEFSVRVEVS